MLQHYAPAPLGAAAYNIVDYLLSIVGAAGVAGSDVPVVEAVALRLHHLGKPCHDAGVEGADGVAAAAGEAEDGGIVAGLLADYLLHVPEVLQPCLLAGVNLAVVMGGGVHADGVALPVGAAYEGVVVRVCGGDEEGGGHAVGAERIQQPAGVGAGAVVKAQVYGAAVGLADLGHGSGQHIHHSCGGHALAVCAHETVAQVVLPGALGIDLALVEHMLRKVIAKAVNGHAARVCKVLPGVDFHVLLADKADGGSRVVVGQHPLHHGLVAGGIADRVDDAVGQLLGFHPVCQVAVVAVVGGVALLHIALQPAGAVALHVHKLDDRGLGVHHMHHAPCAAPAEDAVGLIFDFVAAHGSGDHRAMGADFKVPVALAEETPLGDGVDPGLGVVAALFYAYLLLAAHIEAHPAGVHDKGQAEHQYQPCHHRDNYKHPTAFFSVLFIFHTTYPLYIM